MMKAVIFDMNGVIINDESYHTQSWKAFCKKHGFKLSPQEINEKVMGKRDQDTLKYLFKQKLSSRQINTYSDEREKIVMPLVKRSLQLADGLRKLLDELKQADIPLAIATGSRKGYANFIVANFHLRNYFRHIITAEDITKGKPDPEIYLKAALLLQIKPEDILVFEDSLAGISAAKRAGMKIVGITTTYNQEELSLADKVINSFEEISVHDLNSIKH